MILIIDSGGTKLEWRQIKEEGSIQQGRVGGFHALLTGIDELDEKLISIKKELSGDINKVYFYGAGCATPKIGVPISECISKYFPEATVNVETDLMAVARSLCNDQEGIACILGTGSNSCHYDGMNITKNIPPLGYILGDEGSGVDIGKRLLRAYARGEFPTPLKVAFQKRYDLDLEKILSNVYRERLPNKFIGKFSKFAFDHQRDPIILNIIRSSFNDFFDNVLLSYPDIESLPVHFSGSVAFYFNNILRQVGTDHSISVKNIVESPVAGLSLFHEKELGS